MSMQLNRSGIAKRAGLRGARGRFRLIAAFLPCLVLGLAAGPAHGADAVDIKMLEQHADTIIWGHCKRIKSRWDPRSRLIVTDATIDVRSQYKGDLASTITVTALGGRLPERNLALTVPHAPQFQAGEESMLFLKRDGAGAVRVVGGGSGMIPIVRDAKTGRLRADRRSWAQLQQAVRELVAKSAEVER